MNSNRRLIKAFRQNRPLTALFLAGFVAGAGYAAVSAWPALGAWGADELRGLIGDRAVADLETIVFQIQDVAARTFQASPRIELSPTDA